MTGTDRARNFWSKNREKVPVRSTVYRIMYRVGFTPWEHEPLMPLVELIEGPDALPPGRMLDVGCGTGGDAICEIHGMRDLLAASACAVPRHTRTAVSRRAGVAADITRTGASGLGRAYTLLFDGGCLHGLTPAQRQRAAATMTDAAGPGRRALSRAALAAGCQARVASIPRRYPSYSRSGTSPSAVPLAMWRCAGRYATAALPGSSSSSADPTGLTIAQRVVHSLA